MNNEVLTDEKNIRRLRLLIISRVIIVTLFLSIAIYIDIKRQVFSASQRTINLLYLIAAATYLFSVIYALLLKFAKDLRPNIYIQLSIDVLFVTFLVYLTGSTGSNYSLLYTLIIIYSVIFLGRKGGLIVASASGIFYGLLLDIEFYSLIPPISSVEHDYTLNAGDVFVRILVHIVSFYILAFLASFVVEQEKKTRSLLEEKESAFNQLDLLFRSIIESVDTGVMTINLQGTIKTFNRAAEEITGFPLAGVKNRRITDVFPELVQFFTMEKIDEQIRNRMEVIVTGKKGKKINLGCSISPLKDKNDKQIGNILIFQDITEIRLMEENLEKSKRLALIGEMAAGLAHEMRNPLASITGSIELLKQGLNLDGTDKRLMQIILRGKNQLESFVRDFLLLARPLPTSRELVDLNEVAEEVIENMKLSSEWSSKIKIMKVFSDNAAIFANRGQIRQIIHNLVLNAVQAMDNGGVLSVETALVKLDDKKEYAEIKITDNGCGIDQENLKKIFEPFFTNKDKGTGLGLTIVGRIVEGYGGKIKIESNINIGTSCAVWLPVRDKNIQ
jgi:two-component system sensor histidine kinase PilS (NtrC family)